VFLLHGQSDLCHSRILNYPYNSLQSHKNPLTWGGKAIPERPDWTPNKKYLPIPQGEIEAARGKIEQNPY
ncbi:MAG: hypothetical protein ACI3YZ_05180, partial [Prevotella sp.]